MSTTVKELAIEDMPQPVGVDYTQKRGYLVEVGAGGIASICNATTDLPYGAILDGEPAGGRSAVALSGGNAGTLRLKVSGAVAKGQRGQLAADGTAVADTGAGARTVVCRFLEDGAAGELVESILLDPRSYTS